MRKHRDNRCVISLEMASLPDRFFLFLNRQLKYLRLRVSIIAKHFEVMCDKLYALTSALKLIMK